MMKIADTIMPSGMTYKNELLLQALEREVHTGMLMTNPRYTGFSSFVMLTPHSLLLYDTCCQCQHLHHSSINMDSLF